MKNGMRPLKSQRPGPKQEAIKTLNIQLLIWCLHTTKAPFPPVPSRRGTSYHRRPSTIGDGRTKTVWERTLDYEKNMRKHNLINISRNNIITRLNSRCWFEYWGNNWILSTAMWSNLRTLDQMNTHQPNAWTEFSPESLRLKQTFDVLFSVDAQAQQSLIRQVHQLHAIYTSLTIR